MRLVSRIILEFQAVTGLTADDPCEVFAESELGAAELKIVTKTKVLMIAMMPFIVGDEEATWTIVNKAFIGIGSGLSDTEGRGLNCDDKPSDLQLSGH